MADYATALVVAFAAVAASELTLRPLGGAYFYFPIVAVFFAALRGGVGPGILTVAICAAGFDFFFLGEPFRFGVANREEAHRVALFVLFGLAASLVAGRFRAAHARANRAREEAEAATEEARRIGALQEQLVAVVSHDLRNPLGALRAGLQLLPRLGPLSDRQRTAVERMRSSVDRMNGLIRDVLDVARTRHGAALALRRAPARLGEICTHAIAELQVAHPDAAIALSVDGDDEGELDPERLAQLVSNLVGNALVHGEPGAPVTVRVAGNDQALRLVVENRGPSIPRELLPHLFEPFKRGRSDGHGIGLGLFIVREIARAHGGRIEARSSVEGTAFEVTLPRHAASVGAPPAA